MTRVHRTYNNPNNVTYASGGGGAFAQITFQVYDKDVLTVSVGGGGGVSDGYVLTICNCCLLVCLFVLLPSCNLTVYCYHLLVYGCLIDGWIM